MNLVLCFSCECSQGEYTWADKPVFQVVGKSPPVPLPLGKTLTEVIFFLISYRVTLLIYNIWRFIYWEEGHTFYKRLLTLFIPVFVSFRSPWEHQKVFWWFQRDQKGWTESMKSSKILEASPFLQQRKKRERP